MGVEQEGEGEQQEREEEQEEEREEVIEARRRQGWRLRFLRPARGRRRLETRWGQLPTVADTPPEARPVVSPGYYYYHYYFFFIYLFSESHHHHYHHHYHYYYYYYYYC